MSEGKKISAKAIRKKTYREEKKKLMRSAERNPPNSDELRVTED